MSARYTSNAVTITTDTTHNASLGLRLMLDAIDSQSTPKTPKRRGNLGRDKVKQVLGLHGEIRWDKKYAQVQEAGVIRGSRITHYTTPGTGPHFAENAVHDVVDHSDEYFKRAELI